METGIPITDAVIIATIAIIAAYDVYAVVRWGKPATVSARIREYSHKYPIIPFTFGVLMGHWFW